MMRALVILALSASVATADNAVALLPLDAPAKIDVYGQAVASEIAQALQAGNIDVVVVLKKMSVPEHAKLIVDGKMTQGKGTAIDLTIRIREPNNPKPLQEFQATAASLEQLPKITKELSDKVLPVLRDKLDALDKPRPVDPVTPVKPPPPAPAALPELLVGIGARAPSAEALRAALAEVTPGWAAQHHRAPSMITADMLDAKTAAQTVAGSKADRAIALEVLSYSMHREKTVPLATARVRVRIADAGRVQFDRVVITNTVVGDAGMPDERMASRVAREVLSILQPHVKKAIPGWP
jgi:hypothetical protein